MLEIKGWRDPEAEGRRTVWRLLKACCYLFPVFLAALFIMLHQIGEALGQIFASIGHYPSR
jgi:hypothetical protein